MQEYLKKITIPRAEGPAQELRVLTPGDVEAMLARSYFAAQDEYWANATPEDKERILDTVVAEGLRLEDIWASLKWATECMKYVDADTGELLAYAGEMPKFLPAFDFTDKSVAEIKAYFRYDMNEEGRRNVRVCGGLRGVIPEEIEFELLAGYSETGSYSARRILRLLHTGPVKLTCSGILRLSSFYAQSSRISDLEVKLVRGSGSNRTQFLEFVTGLVPASVSDVAIYVQDGIDAVINWPFNNARELDVRIFGSPSATGAVLRRRSQTPHSESRVQAPVYILSFQPWIKLDMYGGLEWRAGLHKYR